MQGLFITMEGADGSGKSLQSKLLKEYLLERGFDVVTVREPGGTRIGEKIRDIIIDKENTAMDSMTEVLLYAASRAQLTQEVILPSLNAGKIVLSDRFVDSSLVYQGFARGLGIDTVMKINSFALCGLMPDITFFLDLPATDGLKRVHSREEPDRIEMEALSFHNKVYEGYLSLVEMYPERIKSIDASRDIQEVKRSIIEIVEKKLSNSPSPYYNKNK